MCDEKNTRNNQFSQHAQKSIFSNPITAEKAAEFCHKHIQLRFPLGGINTVQTTNRLAQKGAGMLLSTLKLADSLREKFPVPNKEFPPKLNAAYCDELATYALQYLNQTFPEINVEAVVCEAHVFLVLNRTTDSDPSNMLTWGKDAVLYDPWANNGNNIILPHFPTGGFSARILLELPSIEFLQSDLSTGGYYNQHYMTGVGKINMLFTLRVCHISENHTPKERLEAIYIKSLCETYKTKTDKTTLDIHCCLIRAAAKGDIENTQLLCLLGADILAYHSTEKPKTALDWAKEGTSDGHKECVKFLESLLEQQRQTPAMKK